MQLVLGHARDRGATGAHFDDTPEGSPSLDHGHASGGTVHDTARSRLRPPAYRPSRLTRPHLALSPHAPQGAKLGGTAAEQEKQQRTEKGRRCAAPGLPHGAKNGIVPQPPRPPQPGESHRPRNLTQSSPAHTSCEGGERCRRQHCSVRATLVRLCVSWCAGQRQPCTTSLHARMLRVPCSSSSPPCLPQSGIAACGPAISSLTGTAVKSSCQAAQRPACAEGAGAGRAEQASTRRAASCPSAAES